VRSKDKGGIVAVPMAIALLDWASGAAAAAVRIEGQVLAGGGGVAGSAVTLWAASPDAPARLAQVSTDADGRFVVSAEQTPDGPQRPPPRSGSRISAPSTKRGDAR
jgi:hypothetical protein